MKIFMSAPMAFMNILEELSRDDIFKDHDIYIPLLKDDITYEDIRKEIRILDESDIVICHIPIPSNGAMYEVTRFKTKFPERQVIGWKCAFHPHLSFFILSYNLDNLDALREVITKHLD